MLRELTYHESNCCSGAEGPINCTLIDMSAVFDGSTYSFKRYGSAYRGVLESQEACDTSCCDPFDGLCGRYGDVFVPFERALELFAGLETGGVVRGAYYGYYKDEVTYDNPRYRFCDNQCIPQTLVPTASPTPSPAFSDASFNTHYKILQIGIFSYALSEGLLL